jgi:hypothetical protein
MQHAIVTYLLYKKNKYNILKKNAADSFLKILILNDFDTTKTAEYIINNDLSDLYAIKITGNERSGIEDVNEFIRRIDNL